MSRSYLFTFRSSGAYEILELVGHGNVRRTAEASARRRLPKDAPGRVRAWYVDSCVPIMAKRVGRRR